MLQCHADSSYEKMVAWSGIADEHATPQTAQVSVLRIKALAVIRLIVVLLWVQPIFLHHHSFLPFFFMFPIPYCMVSNQNFPFQIASLSFLYQYLSLSLHHVENDGWNIS